MKMHIWKDDPLHYLFEKDYPMSELRYHHLPRHVVEGQVNLTGGNRSGLTGYRSNRSGPVPVSAGTQPAKIQILNLNSKNEKFPKNSLKYFKVWWI